MPEVNLDQIVRELVGVDRKFLPAALSVARLLHGRHKEAESFASDLLEFTSGWKRATLFDVHVDRSVKPSYPDWVHKLMHPELEFAGPCEYDLSKVHRFLHGLQEFGSVGGDNLYKYLLHSNRISACLNLQDGLAIQQKGIAVFRKLFANKKVFFWGSVAQNRDGLLLCVPFLCEDNDEVVMGWKFLNTRFDSRNPALRFSK